MSNGPVGMAWMRARMAQRRPALQQRSQQCGNKPSGPVTGFPVEQERRVSVDSNALLHTPNQVQILEYSHKSGLRKNAYPAGYHPVRTLLRPSMPARIAPSGFGTATRAKNTRDSPCKIPLGLTMMTSPWKTRVGKLLSLTEAGSPTHR